MSAQEKVLEVIFDAVDNLNRQLAEDQRLAKSTETMLMGENGSLDSLGLVNFIVAVEEKIEEQFTMSIVLSDESLILSANSPFRTIGTLVDYITNQLKVS
jgi:acyl carrier protein